MKEFWPEPITLDEQYLGHLREAAFDWGVDTMNTDQPAVRRAAIWMSRNVVTLIDEVRRLRAISAQEHP
jgi:hypothetical protein